MNYYHANIGSGIFSFYSVASKLGYSIMKHIFTTDAKVLKERTSPKGQVGLCESMQTRSSELCSSIDHKQIVFECHLCVITDTRNILEAL